MDFSPIVQLVWNMASWLIPLLLLIGLLKSSRVKGYVGELLVRMAAHWLLDRQIYRRLHNVTLPTVDGSTQIDHVILSPYGIFVLETKNMRGWIFGDERHGSWTQKIYRSTYKFQNPLRQNFKHLKALESVLEIAPEQLHSVIVFVGDCTFKTPMPANVTRGMGLVRHIRSFRQRVFSVAQVEMMLAQLSGGRLAPTRATHRRHVENLRRRSDPTAERQCPKCGNAQVIRTVKNGSGAGRQFWGCSAFPRCRMMQTL